MHSLHFICYILCLFRDVKGSNSILCIVPLCFWMQPDVHVIVSNHVISKRRYIEYEVGADYRSSNSDADLHLIHIK